MHKHRHKVVDTAVLIRVITLTGILVRNSDFLVYEGNRFCFYIMSTEIQASPQPLYPEIGIMNSHYLFVQLEPHFLARTLRFWKQRTYFIYLFYIYYVNYIFIIIWSLLLFLTLTHIFEKFFVSVNLLGMFHFII